MKIVVKALAFRTSKIQSSRHAMARRLDRQTRAMGTATGCGTSYRGKFSEVIPDRDIMSWFATVLASMVPTITGGALGSATTYWQMRRSNSHQKELADLQLEHQRKLRIEEIARATARELRQALWPIARQIEDSSNEINFAKHRKPEMLSETIEREQSLIYQLYDPSNWKEVVESRAKMLGGPFPGKEQAIGDNIVFLATTPISDQNHLWKECTSQYFIFMLDYFRDFLDHTIEALGAFIAGKPIPDEPIFDDSRVA
ncbi:hypothetical protein AB0C74_04620 [Spirillospora sp. NPDC048832]